MIKYAVITAGGMGTRMGSALPKQFLLLAGKPLLWHTLKAFTAAFADIRIILVLPTDYLEAGKALVNDLGICSTTQIVIGGATRFHSVQNGLRCINEASVVFVHDGVRCLVSPELIQKCYGQTIKIGSAIPAVAATDSVRITQAGSHQPIDRNNIRIMQTPQTFLSELILPAFEQPYAENFTDEATVVEASGKTVHLIEGEYSNIKITRPVDLLMAETLMGKDGEIGRAHV